jgi:hypothetical protein
MAGERVAHGRLDRRRGQAVLACAAVLSLAVLAVAPVSASDPPKAVSKEVLQLSMEPLHQRIVDGARQTGQQIVEAYQRSPLLVICLGLAGAVPLVAGLFAVGRALQRRDEMTEVGAVAGHDDIPAGGKAWIEVGEGTAPVVFSGELLRIGRHSDNDIALDHASVHRHHALIQRTPDDEFILIDLTAGQGNKPLLNGKAVERAWLAAGDRISLGDAELTFRLGTELPVSKSGPIHEPKPSSAFARETTYDDGDTADGTTGRPADRVETRRIKPSDGLAARSTHRRRS